MRGKKVKKLRRQFLKDNESLKDIEYEELTTMKMIDGKTESIKVKRIKNINNKFRKFKKEAI